MENSTINFQAIAEEAEQAYLAGKSRQDCPYKEDSMEARAWEGEYDIHRRAPWLGKGIDAGKNGLSITACPEGLDFACMNAWRTGWTIGRTAIDVRGFGSR